MTIPSNFKARIENWARAYRDHSQYATSSLYLIVKQAKDGENHEPQKINLIDYRDANLIDELVKKLRETEKKLLIGWYVKGFMKEKNARFADVFRCDHDDLLHLAEENLYRLAQDY